MLIHIVIDNQAFLLVENKRFPEQQLPEGNDLLIATNLSSEYSQDVMIHKFLWLILCLDLMQQKMPYFRTVLYPVYLLHSII